MTILVHPDRILTFTTIEHKVTKECKQNCSNYTESYQGKTTTWQKRSRKALIASKLAEKRLKKLFLHNQKNLEATSTSTHDNLMRKIDFCTHPKPAHPGKQRIQLKNMSQQQLHRQKGHGSSNWRTTCRQKKGKKGEDPAAAYLNQSRFPAAPL